jgi:hypothetical protein
MRAVETAENGFEEAGHVLLGFALDPRNWRSNGDHRVHSQHLKVVNGVQICVAVDVVNGLDTWLRVSFRGTDLSPMRAADLLEALVSSRLPFTPNTEWEVEIDRRRWIHFSRRYTPAALQG